MKPLLLSMVLFGCATSTPMVGQRSDEMCSAYCKENWSTDRFLHSSESTCICRTESGVKNNLAVCVMNRPEEQANCFLQAYQDCLDQDLPSGDPQYFCTKLKIRLQPFLQKQ